MACLSPPAIFYPSVGISGCVSHVSAAVSRRLPTYDVSVHDAAETVLRYLRKQEMVHAGDRVAVAVSGGADSVALLRLFVELRGELGMVLSVVHFNHKLRQADAELDEEFVCALARTQGLEFHTGSGDVRTYAASHHLSVEAAARKLRYEFFETVMSEKGLNRIATAHTLDDQAETVLLRVVRGAGTRGLAGIYPLVSVANGGSIIRPLLGSARKNVLQYLSDIQQDWREDGSNRDLRFARNRVRHGVLPRLERNLNPAVREALAETAEIARADEEYWAAEVSRVLPALLTVTEGGGLNVADFALLPAALQRRILLRACETLGLRIEFKHVEELLALCGPDGSHAVGLPERWTARRVKNQILILPYSHKSREHGDYEYTLAIPGEVAVAETGTRFLAIMVPPQAEQGYNPEHLLDRERVGPRVQIRNWRPGDRFWPAHTKGPKKIKELLQERKITGTERQSWPVAVSANEVVWVRGFPSSVKLRPAAGVQQAVLIQEVKE